jgi:hypothetical protein
MVAVPLLPPVTLPAGELAARSTWAALLWLFRTLRWLGELALIALIRTVQWVRGLPRENQGVLAVCGLIALVAYAGVVEFLSDPRTLAESLHDAVVAVTVTAVIGVAVLLGWCTREQTVHRSRGHRTTTRMRIDGKQVTRTYCKGGKCGHKFHFDPGTPTGEDKRQLKITGNHEGGHVLLFEERGAKNVRARLVGYRSAWTEGVLPQRPTIEEAVFDSVAVADAGWLACGTKQGAGSDLWMRKQHLKWLPDNGSRSRIGYEGRAHARKVVNSISGRGRIEQVSRSLQRTGKWR